MRPELLSLAQSMGFNLIKHGINVNAIAPEDNGEEENGADALFAKYQSRSWGK